MAVKRKRASRARKAAVLTVLAQFRLVYGAVHRHFRKVEQACGVSGSQLWLLREIDAVPDIGVSDLARRIGVHQSTCSQLVNKLVVQGLVGKTRAPRDRRRIGLRLGAAGRRVLRRAPPPAAGVLPEALASLPAGVLRALRRDLGTLIARIANRDRRDAARHLAEL